MGLFERLFGGAKTNAAMKGYFKTLTAYQPTFISRSGGLYEMDITRAAVHAFATHCSKLKPHVVGSANKTLERKLQTKPNPWQTTSQFLYRVATILEVENTAFLVPVLNKYGNTVGVFPVLPTMCSLVEGKDNQIYLRYQFQNGRYAAVEYDKCGVMTKMQFRDDFWGSSNAALAPTLDLLSVQNQGIQDGIKQAAALRFMAKVGQSLRPEDLEAEQKRFRELNFSSQNNGGVLMFDTKYAEVKQIDSKPYVVDADQMKLINTNCFNYFGCSEAILQNSFDEDEWNSYYEGKVEPFALQLSLVLTGMFYTDREMAAGNEITFSANRLQFASTQNKIEIISRLFDRGMLNRDEGREIMQMPPLPGGEGQKYYVLAEYIESEKLRDEAMNQTEEVNDGQ